MRILLTGVSGQVGSALRRPLEALGEVVAADRSVLDLSRPDDMRAALDVIKPDMIVNPAAYTAVDAAEDDAGLAYAVNATAPGKLAVWSAERNVPLVHFSTDYVFDGSGHRAWRENDPTGPLSVYGASKLAGEDMIRSAGGYHLIIRTSWVYAPAGKNFLMTILRLARERDELAVVADQFGAPTSADIVASATCAILSGDKATILNRFSNASGLAHVAASGETTWHGFASAILEELELRNIEVRTKSVRAIDSSSYPTKAKRPLNSRLDLSLLKSSFGIETPDWKTALHQDIDRLYPGTSVKR